MPYDHRDAMADFNAMMQFLNTVNPRKIAFIHGFIHSLAMVQAQVELFDGKPVEIDFPVEWWDQEVSDYQPITAKEFMSVLSGVVDDEASILAVKFTIAIDHFGDGHAYETLHVSLCSTEVDPGVPDDFFNNAVSVEDADKWMTDHPRGFHDSQEPMQEPSPDPGWMNP